MQPASDSTNSFASMLSSSSDSSSSSDNSSEHLFKILVTEAEIIAKTEPLLAQFLKCSVIHPENLSFESVVARTISTRLVQSCGPNPVMSVDALTGMFVDTMKSDELEHGHTMTNAIKLDMMAYVKRDPACESPLEVLLYFKGFASLVCHRAANRLWKKNNSDHTSRSSVGSRHVSLWLQSQSSAAFGLDIHPGAEIGAGIMLDHGTGIVIGETATVGDNCTFLHGVTLGGTGKDTGDRHPKVAENVLIGAGSSILGNIKIGRGSKIGAGSVVLKPIPSGATAVGAPAKIIGFAKESKPGSSIDNNLDNIVPIGGLEDSDKDTTSTASLDDSFSEGGKEATRVISIDSPKSSHDSLPLCDEPNSLCVFRSFFRRNSVPKGAITYSCLQKLLQNHCTDDEIGEVYMSLLKKNPSLGYIPMKAFAKSFPSVAKNVAKLDMALCTKITNECVRGSTS